MYAGRMAEEAPVADLYRSPRTPYAQGVFGAVPRLGSSLLDSESRLVEIPGVVPSLKQRIPGRVFASRRLVRRCQPRRSDAAHPRPSKGIFVALMFMNRTLASSGRLAM
jgi:oligopeptide/dipeptide ABC transporter ATP-binding protein